MRRGVARDFTRFPLDVLVLNVVFNVSGIEHINATWTL